MGGLGACWNCDLLYNISHDDDVCLQLRQAWQRLPRNAEFYEYPASWDCCMNLFKCERKMGLVLIGMLFASMVLLGFWERHRSKKRFLEASQKLKELSSEFQSGASDE